MAAAEAGRPRGVLAKTMAVRTVVAEHEASADEDERHDEQEVVRGVERGPRLGGVGLVELAHEADDGDEDEWPGAGWPRPRRGFPRT